MTWLKSLVKFAAIDPVLMGHGLMVIVIVTLEWVSSLLVIVFLTSAGHISRPSN